MRSLRDDNKMKSNDKCLQRTLEGKCFRLVFFVVNVYIIVVTSSSFSELITTQLREFHMVSPQVVFT